MNMFCFCNKKKKEGDIMGLCLGMEGPVKRKTKDGSIQFAFL